MKLIKKIDFEFSTHYFYENGIMKEICKNGYTLWNKDGWLDRDNGPAEENCPVCNNKYKRHFSIKNESYLPHEFAIETKHIICKQCNDFCNQECFI